MKPQLEEAFGFKQNQIVRMLVATTGSDEVDNEITFEPGTLAVIDRIEDMGGLHGIAFTLGIGGKITNVFDQNDGLPDQRIFEPVLTSTPGGKAEVFLATIQDAEIFTTSARQHAEDSDEPDHEAGDLQDLLRAAWRLMTDEQKLDFFFQDEVQNVLEAGGFFVDE